MNSKFYQKLPAFYVSGIIMCWVVVIICDMINLFGIGDFLIEIAAQDGSAFVMLFGENRPIEWMQWTCLAGSSMLAAQVSYIEKLNGNRPSAMFSLLMAILFMVLLMEDAGNLRHGISDTIVATGIPQPFFPNFYRMIIYALYATIPVYAVVRFGDMVLQKDRMSVLFWSGFIIYAIAGMLSVSAPIGDFYEVAGYLLNQTLFDGRIIYSGLNFEPGYAIMDMLIEESVELIAAILFITFYTEYKLKIAEPLARFKNV